VSERFRGFDTGFGLRLLLLQDAPFNLIDGCLTLAVVLHVQPQVTVLVFVGSREDTLPPDIGVLLIQQLPD
jgi:hypothetical protein